MASNPGNPNGKFQAYRVELEHRVITKTHVIVVAESYDDASDKAASEFGVVVFRNIDEVTFANPIMLVKGGDNA